MAQGLGVHSLGVVKAGVGLETRAEMAAETGAEMRAETDTVGLIPERGAMGFQLSGMMGLNLRTHVMVRSREEGVVSVMILLILWRQVKPAFSGLGTPDGISFWTGVWNL